MSYPGSHGLGKEFSYAVARSTSRTGLNGNRGSPTPYQTRLAPWEAGPVSQHHQHNSHMTKSRDINPSPETMLRGSDRRNPFSRYAHCPKPSNVRPFANDADGVNYVKIKRAKKIDARMERMQKRYKAPFANEVDPPSHPYFHNSGKRIVHPDAKSVIPFASELAGGTDPAGTHYYGLYRKGDKKNQNKSKGSPSKPYGTDADCSPVKTLNTRGLVPDHHTVPFGTDHNAPSYKQAPKANPPPFATARSAPPRPLSTSFAHTSFFATFCAPSPALRNIYDRSDLVKLSKIVRTSCAVLCNQ